MGALVRMYAHVYGHYCVYVYMDMGMYVIVDTHELVYEHVIMYIYIYIYIYMYIHTYIHT